MDAQHDLLVVLGLVRELADNHGRVGPAVVEGGLDCLRNCVRNLEGRGACVVGWLAGGGAVFDFVSS